MKNFAHTLKADRGQCAKYFLRLATIEMILSDESTLGGHSLPGGKLRASHAGHGAGGLFASERRNPTSAHNKGGLLPLGHGRAFESVT